MLVLVQYFERRKIHQFLWAFAMVLYSVSAYIEYLANADVLGPGTVLIKIYYASAAPLVGFIGAGVLYLLVRKKWADMYLYAVVALSATLMAGAVTADISQEAANESFGRGLHEGFKSVVKSFPFLQGRLPSIILNASGGMLLIGGAAYSFLRDMKRTYNIFLLVGGLMPAVRGTLFGIFQDPSIFFELELGGTVFLFLGFGLSMRYLKVADMGNGVSHNRLEGAPSN